MGWPITHPSTIYAIRCKENGKVYIGRTYRFERRIREHFYELRYRKKNKINLKGVCVSADFQIDYNRFEEQAFEVYILQEGVLSGDCQKAEAKWIAEYDATNPLYGYNIRNEKHRPVEAITKAGTPPKAREQRFEGEQMLVENIQRLCKAHNTTFWSLDRELKIGNGVIAKWSKSSPRVETVQKVAEYFDVTVDELLAIGSRY